MFREVGGGVDKPGPPENILHMKFYVTLEFKYIDIIELFMKSKIH